MVEGWLAGQQREGHLVHTGGGEGTTVTVLSILPTSLCSCHLSPQRHVSAFIPYVFLLETFPNSWGQQTKLMPAPPELVPTTEGMAGWHIHKPHPIPWFPGPHAHSGNLFSYLISHLPYYCFLGTPHNELLALDSWNKGWLSEDPQRKTLNITILIYCAVLFLMVEMLIFKVWLHRHVSILMVTTPGPLCLGVKIGRWLPELED